MNYPSISIIIPVYNGEKYLNRCLDSIIAQSYTNFECLLIDDGSTDGSYKILTEYAAKDSRFKVFHKENGGVSSARNLGLENMRGDWVTFCDCDDLMGNDYLQSYFATKMDSTDLVVQGMTLVQSQKEIKHSAVSFYGNIQTGLELLFKEHIIGYTVNKLFKVSIIKKHNIVFDTSLTTKEDYTFVMSYCCYVNHISINSSCNYKYYLPNGNKLYKNQFESICRANIAIKKCADVIFNTDSNLISEKSSLEFAFNFFNNIHLFNDRRILIQSARTMISPIINKISISSISKFAIFRVNNWHITAFILYFKNIISNIKSKMCCNENRNYNSTSCS